MNAITSPSAVPSPRTVAQRIADRGLDRYLRGLGVEYPEVCAVPTPRATDTFAPISHQQLYEQVTEKLDRVGIKQTETFHSLYRGGDRYIGLALVDLLGPESGREVAVGWFNSHDHSHAVTFLLGEQVTACFNLCLHAEIKVTRKHTKHLQRDLPRLIEDAVDRIGETVEVHQERMRRYEQIVVREREAAHLLVQLLDAGAFPKGSFHTILEEWRSPSTPQWRERWNVNRLYQAVTVQRTPIGLMPRRHRALHRVLDAHVDPFFGDSDVSRLLRDMNGALTR